MPTPRQAALSMLNQVLNEERLLSESAAQRALEGLDGASKARAMRLANETLRNLERADKLLKSHLRKPPAPYVMNLCASPQSSWPKAAMPTAWSTKP